MAHFWIEASEWALVNLAGDRYWLGGDPPWVHGVGKGVPPGAPALVRIPAEPGESWVLVASAGPPPTGARRRARLPAGQGTAAAAGAVPPLPVAINGAAPGLGLVVLRDRDEVRLASGRRLFFSTERLPQIVPFPGSERALICARCRTAIAPGALAVCCPGCGTWCHQSAELPCWRYEGTTHCPLCAQSNDPEAGYRWTPEVLSHAS